MEETRPKRRKADESAGIGDVESIRDLAKRYLKFEQFATNLHMPKNLPRENSHQYAQSTMMTPEEERVANTEFVQLQKLFFGHFKRNPNTPRETDVIPMQLYECNEWVWKLFVGVDWKEKTCTYEMIDKLLSESEEVLLEYKEARHDYKMQYLDGETTKSLEVDGVWWIVKNSVDLPWIIPVSFHYHNPKAVKPAEAYPSEMEQCGRIIGTNERLYKTDPIYKKLLYLATKLEKRLMFDEIAAVAGTETSLFFSWFRNCNVWYKPPFKLYVSHNYTHGYHIFIGIPRNIVEANRDKILIPKFTIITSLEGEIRPLDLSVHERYASEIYRPANHGYEDKSLPITNLVSTSQTNGKRPGIGNVGFFSNSTCVQEPLFSFRLSHIGDKQGNVVEGAQFSYKHCSIVAEVDITGNFMLEKYQTLLRYSVTKHPYLVTEGDLICLPVEWKYSEEAPDDGQYTCACMTRCYARRDRTRIHLGKQPTVVRTTDKQWTREEIMELRIKQNKKDRILAYLRQFPATEGGLADGQSGGLADGQSGGDVPMPDSDEMELEMALVPSAGPPAP